MQSYTPYPKLLPASSPPRSVTCPDSPSEATASKPQIDCSPSEDFDDPSSETCNGCANSECLKCKDTRTLACPFFRRAPIHFQQCINHKFRRIRDIKQHLQRRHTQSTHCCPVCYERFSLASDLNIHLRARSCELGDESMVAYLDSLSGVSVETLDRLRERARRTATTEEKWYEVWDIVFDGVERPANAYLGTPVEETIDMIRGLLVQEGPQLVRGALERGHQQQMLAEEDLVSLFMELLNGVQGRFDRVRKLGFGRPRDNGPTVQRNPVTDPPSAHSAALSAGTNDWNGLALGMPELHGFDQSYTQWGLFGAAIASHSSLFPANYHGENITEEDMYTLGWGPPAQDPTRAPDNT